MLLGLYNGTRFPLDLTADICRERGVSLDLAGFEAAMQQQRERRLKLPENQNQCLIRNIHFSLLQQRKKLKML